MAKQTDLSFIDEIEELKAIPAVVMELTGMLNNPSIKGEKITKKIEMDAAITAYVLKYCNAAYWGPRVPIKTISHAIKMIGLPRCRSILMAYFFRCLLRKVNSTFINNYLWEHSLAVAFFARERATQLKLAEEEGEEAYIAGLLHDIGKLVIYYFDSEKYESLLKVKKNETLPFILNEKETYGYSHVETGEYLLKRWRFPELFRDSVSNHHGLENFKEKDTTVQLVIFANSMAHFALDQEMDPTIDFLNLHDLSEEQYNIIFNNAINTMEGESDYL